MALIQARVKLTNGDGKVYTKDSNSLNLNTNVTALPNDLSSDKLLVMAGAMNQSRFYFVAGDKLLIEKATVTTTPVVTKTGVINVTKTGWQLLSDLAPAGFKESEIGGSNLFSCRYFIEPVEYTGDRYYATSGSLDRISSINFCKRLIFAASELAPAGIKDTYAFMSLWGETNPDTGVIALVIPETMDDLSGLFDNAGTIGPFSLGAAMPKIITLGKIKKMHRTFYNAFSYDMTIYSPPVDAVVFGEMDVSEVTDFSYCFGQCFQANPDIENWNVSSATNMTGMFGIVVDWIREHWTSDLSNWCVSKITSEPANFALNHPMSAAQKPVWGTCPVRIDGKTLLGTFTLVSGNTREGTVGYNRNKYLLDSNLYVSAGSLTPITFVSKGVTYTITAILYTTGPTPEGAVGYQVSLRLDKNIGDKIYLRFNNEIFLLSYHYVSVDDYNYILNPVWALSDGPHPDLTNGGKLDLLL